MDNNSIEKNNQEQKGNYIEANVENLTPEEQKRHFHILMSERPWMHKAYVKSYMDALNISEEKAILFIKDVHGDLKDNFSMKLRNERIKEAMDKHNMSYTDAFYFVESEDRVIRNHERGEFAKVDATDQKVTIKVSQPQQAPAQPTPPQVAPQPQQQQRTPRAYLKCGKCGETQNITVQTLAGLKRRSCLGTALLTVCTCGIYLIYMVVKGRKNTSATMAVCQRCGNTWNV